MTLPKSDNLQSLFEKNRKWADSVVERDPDFFKKLSAQQTPEYMWIGCADSRVPATEIVNLAPGEVFVHRNIANVVVPSDLNCLSVLQYAVDVLKVKHVVVTGHYGCGGVQAVVSGLRIGLADNWLQHVKDVQQKHERYLGETIPIGDQLNRLCELNVIEQVVNLSRTTIVQDAWDRGQSLTLHGWVYGLKDGLLRDMEVTASGMEELAVKLKESYARYEG